MRRIEEKETRSEAILHPALVKQTSYTGGGLASTAAGVELLAGMPSAAMQGAVKYSTALMAITGPLTMYDAYSGLKQPAVRETRIVQVISFGKGVLETGAGMIFSAYRTLTLVGDYITSVSEPHKVIGQVGTGFALGSYTALGLVSGLKMATSIERYFKIKGMDHTKFVDGLCAYLYLEDTRVRTISSDKDGNTTETVTTTPENTVQWVIDDVILEYPAEDCIAREAPCLSDPSRPKEQEMREKVYELLSNHVDVSQSGESLDVKIQREVNAFRAAKVIERLTAMREIRERTLISYYGAAVVDSIEEVVREDSTELNTEDVHKVAREYVVRQIALYAATTFVYIVGIIAFALLTWGSGGNVEIAAASLLVTSSVLGVLFDGLSLRSILQENLRTSKGTKLLLVGMAIFTLFTTITAIIFASSNPLLLFAVAGTGVSSLMLQLTVLFTVCYKEYRERSCAEAKVLDEDSDDLLVTRSRSTSDASSNAG